ncbi:MAG: hypothetical protein B7Z74_09425 [Deltaproteobacteria bacterium 21-66-5]|nr:MAG: hypothetical protein B7Z74_09425 [Deltaproteobacteria bacterium 21-66-5]
MGRWPAHRRRSAVRRRGLGRRFAGGRSSDGQPAERNNSGAAGQVLGRMEYLGPDSRSDAEIRAAVKRFLDDYLSLNSTTIFDDYAAAHAWYAYWHAFMVGQNWADDPRAMLEAAERLADRTIRLDPFDARGLTIAGHVRAFLHRQLDEALVLHERALALNPNLAMAWALTAITHAYLGNVEEAERCNRRYKKLSPLDPFAFFFDAFFVLIDLMKHDYESAVATGRSVVGMNPAFSAAYKPYLAALGYLGRTQEAAVVRQRLLAIEPDFSVQRFRDTTPMQHEADRAHYAEGLRRAGVAENSSTPSPAGAPLALRL